MSSQPSPTVSIGQTLDDKYRVLDVLGEGGMGIVYSAWHLGLEQRVAVKVLRSEDPDYDAIARQRFQREARAAARLHSEHVCRVLDTGTLGDGTPYLVMEHLDGCDLATELLKRGRLPLADAVRHVRQTCAAVSEAHRAGIVHRDLKPANLFLHVTPTGERLIKILDFGVSKSSTHQGLSLTRTAALVGSPIYMSPEQIKSSRDVDARTDIWSLGTILAELIAGRPLFDQETIGQLVTAILHQQPPTLAELGCQVPEGLDAVIQRALHKDCEHRYQTVEELSAALAPFESDAQRLTPAQPVRELAVSTMRPGRVRSVPAAESLRFEAASPVARRAGSLVSRLRRGWPLLLAASAALALFFLFPRGSTREEPTGARSRTGEDRQAAPTPFKAPDAPAASAPLGLSGDADTEHPETEPTIEAPSALRPEPRPVPAASAGPIERKHEPRRPRQLGATSAPMEPARRAEPPRAEDNVSSFGGRR